MSLATDNQTAGFAQVNPIASLVPPVDNPQQPKAQPVADCAHMLVTQFAVAESTQARTVAIWNAAKTLTCAEFDTAMGEALKMAAKNDKLAGFVPADDAKGRAKYGPTQSSLTTLASQCRQVFGACKIDPECIVSLADGAIVQTDLFPNWSRAYTLAAKFLTDKGLDWQGNILSAMQAAAKQKKTTAATADILAEVMADHPQNPGETMADYMERIADDVETAREAAANKATQEAAKKELTRLIKVYGDNVADVLEAMVTAHNAMADAGEASM